jgi:hypothetical protein
MATKSNEEDSQVDEKEISIPAQIQAFAAKLGDEVGNQFTCYVYRVTRDEETGRIKKPFVKKYVGIEPDPLEIAEKFRGGTYAIQFIWKSKSKADTGNKSFTLDVDSDAFPAIPKNDKSIMPYAASGMSENMQLQLTTIQAISEVMKTAYSSGNAINQKGVVQSDPLEMFTGLMETMEGSFARAMAIQSKIMERVFTRNMERQYGLGEEIIPGPVPGAGEDVGIVGKYAPVVREIVDGIKTVVGFFGTVPPDVVKKVKSNERFQGLLKDQKALVVIGQALRQEFGDQKAADLMHTFGVRMVIKDQKPERIAQTPSPASIQGQGQGQVGGRVVPAGSGGPVAKKPINKVNGKVKG